MANAVNNVEVSDVDDFEMSEAERKTIKGELNELLNPKNGDDKEESRQTLSAQEVVEQPDVAQLIESVAKLNWTEASGKCFVGTGFLAKITLGVEDRLGFFTAGHNLYDKGTKQLVKASDIKLRFKDIRKHTIKVAFSKFLRQNYLLIVAYKTTKIISRNGQESTQPCRKGLDFGAVIFTDPVDSAARFLSRLGLSYLQVASPGACSSAYKMPVQLIGFPQYEENYSPMRILPGNELVVPPGNIPDHSYDLETEPGASGGSVLDKAGRVVAVHIRGGDQGNWGLGFDIIREELQLCHNIPSLLSQAQPGTSDPHKPQGMPSVVKFMKNLKLGEYISAFEEHHIDMEVLEDCEPEELEQMLEKMEVSLGHSKKIKKALKHEKQEKKEQMKKEQEREEDQLENIDANMFIKGLNSYTDAVEREETTFNVEVKDPNAPVDFYINGKKVSKSDTRCKYVNVGEGKHQLILHNIKMEDMGTIEARSPSNRGDEMLTSSTKFEVAMGEHAPEVGDCGPVTGIPNKKCYWKLPYKCEGVQQSPPVVTVMFRGKELKIGLDVNVIIHQGNIELSVINPKREKSGIYTVTMKNARGESSRDINVNIMGVNETAAASNVKMLCGVIIRIIVIAVIAVIIAPYYYKGGELSCPSLNINTQDRRDVEELKSIESAEECSNKCREKTTCKFWTWHHKDAGIWALDCVLMSGYGYANSDNNVISGSRTCNPGVKEQCLVLFPYTAQNDDEITLEEGQIVLVISKEVEDKGWWKGEIDGRTGVFPENFVKLVAAAAPEEISMHATDKLGEIQKHPWSELTGDLIVSADEGEAAEWFGSLMGLYRQLDGSSYQQVGGSYYLYQVLPERHWVIGDVLMKKTGFYMKNPTESSSVPASGWKFWTKAGGWRDDPELSARMVGQELQCNTITITSSRCTRQEVLGDYRRIKNDVLNGHPVFRNSFNHYLRVRTGATTWSVSDQRDSGGAWLQSGGAWLQSGRATSCPAHPNSGLTRRVNRKHWQYWDGEKWVEDPTLFVTCNDTVKK